jgi:hypothetical protein
MADKATLAKVDAKFKERYPDSLVADGARVTPKFFIEHL